LAAMTKSSSSVSVSLFLSISVVITQIWRELFFFARAKGMANGAKWCRAMQMSVLLFVLGVERRRD
ncbi:MAG: hypothetical protein PUJ24_11045, partial [Bacteroidales bacterium]|nr:hypothetical protein [Bacteroidales bacterium]